jgi:nicotinamide-nucleotide amidase
LTVTRPRAAVVVTGSELVRGDRTDLNGPFLAREALALGLEPARISIVGDRPDELDAALREALGADLCLVSGGLGPTHDDRTVETVARLTERPLVVDPELQREIEGVSRLVADRLRRPYADFEAGVRKQASLPEGAMSLGLAGTAPGLLLEEDGGRVVVVLPGPPGELRRLWQNAVASEPMRRLVARTTPPGRRVLRFYGASESAVARALEEAGGDGDGVEATICARDFEIHVDLLVDPGAEERADVLAERLAAPLGRSLFSRDERPVQELVLALCRSRGLRLATAESSTGGMVAARLTDVPGSSDVFVGGIVAYANEVKRAELGVPADVLERHGAVSPETAAAMALGARERLGVDVAVSVTGIAGPGGGSKEKPVGLVYFHAVGPDGERPWELDFPGDRDAIRRRSAVTALHLVRRLLTQNRDERV